MSEPTFMDVREAFHQEVHRNPDNIALIANNYATALWRLGVSPTTFEACILELHRRWEYARTRNKDSMGGK